MKKIKVFIVEDSALMRKQLINIIDQDKQLQVVGYGYDGEDALRKIPELDPDVITIDIGLPGMDGISCLQHIMIEMPRPCIMISAYSEKSSIEAFEALELGAVSFIEKPGRVKISRKLDVKTAEIISKIKEAAAANLSQLDYIEPIIKSTDQGRLNENLAEHIICFGVSTGGPRTLMKIIPNLDPKINCPVLITQHMPARFTYSFAQRMNKYTQLEVKEAENNEVLKNNTVYVAPGNMNMTLYKDVVHEHIKIKITPETKDDIYCPNIDKTFNSVVDIYGKNAIGVILTGMGDDGLRAMQRLHKLGGYTIAESENSAIVFGMPRAVIENEAADSIIDADYIHKAIHKKLDI